MSNCEKLNEYLKDCDWDSAVFFKALAKPPCNAVEVEHAQNNACQNAKDNVQFVCGCFAKASLDEKTKKVVWQQAFALCFKQSQDHSEEEFDDAVEAATKAIATTDADDDKNIKARCVRAYAYYLNGNYEQAIAESDRIILVEGKGKFSQAERFALELLALVYNKLDDHLKVNESYRKLFEKCFTSSESEFFPASPLLMDAYRESVKQLNRR